MSRRRRDPMWAAALVSSGGGVNPVIPGLTVSENDSYNGLASVSEVTLPAFVTDAGQPV